MATSSSSSSFLTPPLSPKSSPADTSMQADLSTSVSSLSGSGFLTPSGSSPSPLGHILVLYHKATSTFLLRQLASAYSTSLEALELLARTNSEYGLDQHNYNNISESTRRSFFVLKQKLWILHVTIYGAMLTDRAENQNSNLSSSRFSRSSSSKENSPEKLVKDLWRRLVDDYGGVEGEVDGQVMVPFVLLCIHQKLYTLARQITETYLATLPEGLLIHLETAAGALTTVDSVAKDPLMTNYERLVELYLIHILAKLSEWTYASEFLEYNSVLSDASKKVYAKILDKLHQKSLRPKKTAQKSSHHQQRSSITTATSSAVSTSVSSPTLSSASSMGSPSMSQSFVDEPSLDNSAVAPSTTTASTTSTMTTSSGKTKSSSKKKTSSALSTTPVTKAAVASSSTLQSRFWILLRHYIELIKSAGNQMGPSQLMVVVGIVVFLGALARNRARASRVVKAGMAKVMQTVKMGTTVTSI
ncbi:hypothetical protein BG006_000583 [Podila minutissima]|uniref:Uncharacterized protein n=1 Tax=Podila minutissima TaxID=64525 RepID=A0A9P5ST40_9FUNG|nr:hypothetical protein BG006_000583 [Podila minutissima]